MPYFIFRIPSSGSPLEHLDTKDRYQEAKAVVTRLREDPARQDEATIRMVFASSGTEAEKLLSTPTRMVSPV